MDARRTYVLVALAAVGTAALVVGLVAFTRTSPRAAAETSTTTSGRAPALVLDLGLRTDPEAVALRRANRLYSAGRRRAAGRIFARYRSVEAHVGAAVSAWPNGTVARLDELAARYPSSGVVLLHLGLAQVASGAGKAGESPRNGSSRPPRASLQALPRRRPPPRSASSRRPSPSSPSPGSGRSRPAFRARRASASTSASCSSGSASSTRRARSCGSRDARNRRPRSAGQPPSSSRSSRDSRKPIDLHLGPTRPN